MLKKTKIFNIEDSHTNRVCELEVVNKITTLVDLVDWQI